LSNYIVALTGASGAIYGVRLIDELLAGGEDVELIISPSGFLILAEELGIRCTDVEAPHAIMDYIEKNRATRGARAKGGGVFRKSKKEGRLISSSAEDLTGAAASGSSLKRAMVICPCSMGSLARIAAGVSGNLIERAADCVLKERGRLVMVPRETPLNDIHLENMLRLSRAGATMLPAMPAWYHHPETVDDMADFIVGKILDVLGVENDLFKRWHGPGPGSGEENTGG